MSKKSVVKLSDAELRERIERAETKEVKLKIGGIYVAVIGLIGMIIFMLLDIETVWPFFGAMLLVGIGIVYLGGRVYQKSRSLVLEQLNDFFEAELEKAFGPNMKTSELPINNSFIGEIRPLERSWNECNVWRFYEGNYHGTHFSAANVQLNEVTIDGEGCRDTKTLFKGAVLRCKDICDPALDIVLREHGTTDRESDLVDPTASRQYFSASTADGQPADDRMTPQLCELLQKLRPIASKYPMNKLMFRNGEAILVISGYTFAEGLPSDNGSLRNLDEIRSRFGSSLTSVGDLVDILRDSFGKE